jgi:hypothetical protein
MLDAGTVELLRGVEARQTADALMWGSDFVHSGLVFTMEDGRAAHARAD